MRRLTSDDRGSTSIEMVILGPAFLLLLSLLVMGGRVAIAQQAVSNAASEAARAASLSRGQDHAETRARTAADTYLSGQMVQCTGDPVVDVDVSAFSSAPGDYTDVTATVSCTVDLAGLDLGAGVTVEHTATSPVDTYRER